MVAEFSLAASVSLSLYCIHCICNTWFSYYDKSKWLLRKRLTVLKYSKCTLLPSITHSKQSCEIKTSNKTELKVTLPHIYLSLSPPAPCVPTHLTARVDCQTGITVVTWDAARGATSYTVYARGNLGHNAECNSTDTNCDFLNLACGQDYTITVVARHDSCVSLVSESINATTGNKTKAYQLINSDVAVKDALRKMRKAAIRSDYSILKVQSRIFLWLFEQHNPNRSPF